MKININFTVDVDKEKVESYMAELGTEETIREFVKSWYVSAGIGSLDESIYNSTGEYITTDWVR